MEATGNGMEKDELAEKEAELGKAGTALPKPGGTLAASLAAAGTGEGSPTGSGSLIDSSPACCR